jgi:hypothetical protein
MVGYGLSLLVVAVIVGVAVALAWRRRGGNGLGRRAGQQLRTLEFVPLGPSDRLILAECDGKRYLLAQGSRGVTLIDRLPDGPPPVPGPASAALDAGSTGLAA